MPKELFWLTLTVVMTGLLWVPYIIDRIMVRGLMGTLANPRRTDKSQSPWAIRLMFAHSNAVENLVVFAVLVLVADSLNIHTNMTVFACALYFWSRLAHVVVYTAGLPVGRTLAFVGCFVAQAIIAVAIFQGI